MSQDKLTPAQLRDLAEIFDSAVPGVTGHAYGALSTMRAICNSEAARREAEAKPVKISQPECHEPGGCIAPVACVQFGKCPQKPEAAPQGEREGPGSAAADDTLPLGYLKRDGIHYVDFTLADVRGVLAEAKHVLSAARLKPFLPLLNKETK